MSSKVVITSSTTDENGKTTTTTITRQNGRITTRTTEQNSLYESIQNNFVDGNVEIVDDASVSNLSLIGALGGIIVGFQTKFLSLNKFPPPNTPFPLNWNIPETRKASELIIKSNSFIWRVSKRAFIAGIMFDVLVGRRFEQGKITTDWKNTTLSGLICGSIFGLRGGFNGSLQGALSFGVLGVLSGLLL